MEDIYDFLNDFESFLREKFKNDVLVYARHTYLGSMLLKNSTNNKRLLLKPSDSTLPIGGKRIQDFIAKSPTFKGYKVDNYIFIARVYKEISYRLAKSKKRLTLVAVDFEEKQIKINGAMNVELNILNLFIEFSEAINFSISYDFEGLLKHQGFDRKSEKTITQIEKRLTNPVIFFSYSWDNEEHRFWVLKLASELIKNGIDVLIDEWDLDKYNNDLHQFMESGIRDSDKVILVCTKQYAQKANERAGGVGVENTIITGEFYDKSKENKFIPIVREYDKKITDSMPSYLKTKYSIDFSKDDEFRTKFEELIRKILNVPRFKKPTLGNLPSLKSNEI